MTNIERVPDSSVTPAINVVYYNLNTTNGARSPSTTD